MITYSEERRSQGPLIVFIDLLFLLVAFFVLLLFFVRGHQEISEQALETMQESLSRITGEEMKVPEALQQPLGDAKNAPLSAHILSQHDAHGLSVPLRRKRQGVEQVHY